MPVAAAAVIAIRIADAGHRARFTLCRCKFALPFYDTRQRRIQQSFRRGSFR